MKALPKIVAIVFAFFLVTTHSTQAQSVFPIQITDDGHILLEAKINGVQGSFLFDTGAGLTVITKDFASKIDGLTKLDGGYTGFRATGERLDLNLYRGASVKIGARELSKSAISIIDMDWPVDGILSLTHFKAQPFTIDFENKKFYLESPTSLVERKAEGTTVPVQLEDSRNIALDVFTYITVNDSLTLQTSLDSGAGFDVFRIKAEYMPALDIDSSKVEKTYKQSNYNPDEGNTFYHTTLDKMMLHTFPKINVEDFNVTFVQGLIYDAIMSINWLGSQITFDLAREEMIVQ